ncbi:MAG: thiamine ABC transporter substrate-binding protein [Chloroflexi bacterium]|nr:thiamine ABC transporter substrate-binding protein [Chloroflexota bacterium]
MIRLFCAFTAITLALLIPISCTTQDTPSTPEPLTIITHDSFDIGTEIIAAFEAEHNAAVSIVKGGDAGEVINKAILTKGNPIGDVLYGIDNTFLTRALNENIFVKYRSPVLDNVDPIYHLDTEHRVMPVDVGFVAINYDDNWLSEAGLSPPNGLGDLTQPQWKGLLVVQNPATSSPGLAFLLSTIAKFGETGDYTYLDYWQELKENDVLVKNGWSDSYYSDFSLHGGERPLVVSYSTSPAAEVFYSEGAHTTPPSGVMTTDGSAFMQIEGIGILQGSNHETLAKKFVDFSMDTTFQEDFPTRMWVFPTNKLATTSGVFADFAEIPSISEQVSPESIDLNRERWIKEWTNVVIR